MHRINLIGRGGQGVVKASRMLVSASLEAGLYATALPQFDFVRRGGPVEAFVRVSDQPIRRKSKVQVSDYVVAFDAGMKELPAAIDRAATGATVLLNTNLEPDDLEMPTHIERVGTVDATTIANERLEKNPIPIVNTTMLGVLAKAMPELDRESLATTYEAQFGDGGEMNVEAAAEAYETLRMQEARVSQ
jgi:pyruvate ferredoxin oxidoreductase gamma subunit